MTSREKIKKRRKELNMTADDLAAKIGVSRSTIFRYENGDIEQIPLEKIGELSIVLDIDPGELIHDEGGGWTGVSLWTQRINELREQANNEKNSDDNNNLNEKEKLIFDMLREIPEEKQSEFLDAFETILKLSGLIE